MADGVEEQAVGEGAVAPLEVDPNLEYEVRTFRLAAGGKSIVQSEPQQEGLEGSGRVLFRGFASLNVGGREATLQFDIFADSRAEAWEKFDERAKEEFENIKAAALRKQLAKAPKIGEFRRQRMGRRLGGGNGGGPR